jgi:catechol 2,3-dioxygenase-like lactoylglutathione lyase family enzyme
MTQTLAHIAIVVPDYDDAIDHYTRELGFDLIEDTPRAPGKRWVLVSPPGNRGASLLLAKAANAEQQSRIGNQTGGRVFLFLHTDDFARDHQALLANGVHFIEAPRHEEYGTVAVFEDRYGNRWDLIEYRKAEVASS